MYNFKIPFILKVFLHLILAPITLFLMFKEFIKK